MKRLYRVIFSSAFLSALIIVGQILLLGLALIYAASSFHIAYAVSALINLTALINLAVRDCNPEFKLSWLVIVMLLPFFGAILYLFFYKRRMSGVELSRAEKIKKRLLETEDSERAESLENLARLGKMNAYAASEAISIMHDDELASLFSDSALRYFPRSEEMYENMLKDIKAAKGTVFLEYFIVAEGQMLRGVLNILKEKAREGLDVRLIFDELGSLGRLPCGFIKELKGAGIKAMRFGTLTPFATPAHNSRNHRKLLIIDGRIAYTGGINIADEYINLKSPYGHWKDGGVRIEGRAARGFLRMFLHTYSLTGSEPVGSFEHLFTTAHRDKPCPCDGGLYLPFCDGPSPIFPNYTSKSAIINMINGAKEFLYITTPYLIIDYDMTEALRRAASRGIDVRIITPGIPDKKIVKIMTKSAYPYLISGGVRIFEYEKGFIHEKIILSGAGTAIVGTINLDYRSLVHHLEDGLFIFGSPELEKIKDEFFKTLDSCWEVKKSSARLTATELAVRAIARLFAPLL